MNEYIVTLAKHRHHEYQYSWCLCCQALAQRQCNTMPRVLIQTNFDWIRNLTLQQIKLGYVELLGTERMSLQLHFTTKRRTRMSAAIRSCWLSIVCRIFYVAAGAESWYSCVRMNEHGLIQLALGVTMVLASVVRCMLGTSADMNDTISFLNIKCVS